MERHPVILSIAGSDCSGGAGIQADIKTISALGGYAASAITAVTVQNTLGVRAVHAIPPEIVCGQIEAVMEDLQPVAVKIGMVNDIQIVHVIADCIRKYSPEHIIYDPVMVSTSGRKLMTNEAIEEIKKKLLPLVTLVTPNIDEAKVLTGKSIQNTQDMGLITVGELFGSFQHILCILDAAMHENPVDLYALYGCYDDNNLYLMWEMTNVQDVVAPGADFPLSNGVL
jgi:hydroxymethylpyrimidine/phosphomethylpyrimidine kinase